MDTPLGIACTIPSRLAMGESFAVKVKVLGPVRTIDTHAGHDTPKPALHGPFNLNNQRQIQFVDNVLPAWEGRLEISADGALAGPGEICFDGEHQGAFPGDTRPIKVCDGFAWNEPGFHFVHLTEPETGIEVWSNPVYVTTEPPVLRLYWGDPHWQTFFSDGIRCPEELYAFARNEAFLDFGAISDHMEAVTERQWDYFQAVTNDYNEPGRFATLLGQEWTHHYPEFDAPGHRNIYFRDADGPALRSTDSNCNTLEKLWATLDAYGRPAVAIPHHSANVVMGVKWELGWNPEYEKAVEIYSVWGSSEKPATDGNLRPIHHCDGEVDGRHVLDALKRGYRFGFMGGGDVHDGRPGETMHQHSYPKRGHEPYDNGLTGVWIPELNRESVFDAICNHYTYATTCSRIYLEVDCRATDKETYFKLRTASEDGISRAVIVQSAGESELENTEAGARVLEREIDLPALAEDDFLYIRIETTNGEMAWSSPAWRD